MADVVGKIRILEELAKLGGEDGVIKIKAKLTGNSPKKTQIKNYQNIMPYN